MFAFHFSVCPASTLAWPYDPFFAIVVSSKNTRRKVHHFHRGLVDERYNYSDQDNQDNPVARSFQNTPSMKSANNIPLLINVMIDRDDTTAPFEGVSRNRILPANM